jgi:hypothetical protein
MYVTQHIAAVFIAVEQYLEDSLATQSHSQHYHTMDKNDKNNGKRRNDRGRGGPSLSVNQNGHGASPQGTSGSSMIPPPGASGGAVSRPTPYQRSGYQSTPSTFQGTGRSLDSKPVRAALPANKANSFRQVPGVLPTASQINNGVGSRSIVQRSMDNRYLRHGGAYAATAAHTKVTIHSTQYEYVTGKGWKMFLCRCRDPQRHGDAFSLIPPTKYPPNICDIQGRPINFVEIFHQAMDMLKKDFIDKNEVRTVEHLILDAATTARMVANRQKRQKLVARKGPKISGALPPENTIIWHGNVNPKGFPYASPNGNMGWW